MTAVRHLTLLSAAAALAACGAAVPAIATSPRPSPTGPAVTASPAAPAVPPAAARLWVLQEGGGDDARLVVVDAASGRAVARMAAGVFGTGGMQVVAVDPNGPHGSRLQVLDARSGEETRGVDVALDDRMPMGGLAGTPTGLSADGSYVVLAGGDLTPDGRLTTTRFHVYPTATLASPRTVSLPGDYQFAGIDDTGTWLSLLEYGSDQNSGGAVYTLRRVDLRTGALEPTSTVDAQHRDTGLSGVPMESLDVAGHRLTTWAFGPSGAFLHDLDLTTGTSTVIDLPGAAAQNELELLWSLSRGPGDTAYAVDAGTGEVVVVDARTARITRRGHLALPAATATPAGLALPGTAVVAEAKRAINRGATLSPDGRTLYALADRGIAVVDTATLTLRTLLDAGTAYQDITIAPDGSRLYGVTAPDAGTGPGVVQVGLDGTVVPVRVPGPTTAAAVLKVETP